MNFKHKFLDFEELSAEVVEGVGRVYTTPKGDRYPSVTTVIGTASDKSWLKEWEDRVGKEQAQKITAQAGRRGTAVHDIAEKYLRNDKNYKKSQMPVNMESFSSIKKILDENITEVYGLEIPLYSNYLRTAGRVDVLSLWKDELAIVDFKTSRRLKKHEDIHSYFIQESAYAYMVFERTGLLPRKIVTVMMVDNSSPLIFEENTRDWIKKFINMRNSVDILC